MEGLVGQIGAFQPFLGPRHIEEKNTTAPPTNQKIFIYNILETLCNKYTLLSINKY